MKKIFSFFLVITLTAFCLIDKGNTQINSSKDNIKNPPEETEKLKTKETAPIVIKGHLLIEHNHLFLRESEEKVYRIIDKDNPQVYASLLSLVKEKTKENKGLKAKLSGKAGPLGEILTRTIKYTKEGKVASKEGEKIPYIEFNVMGIEETGEVPLKEIKEIKIVYPAEVPEPAPIPLPLRRIRGKVTATHFDKVIPYIEIKDAELASFVLEKKFGPIFK